MIISVTSLNHMRFVIRALRLFIVLDKLQYLFAIGLRLLAKIGKFLTVTFISYEALFVHYFHC